MVIIAVVSVSLVLTGCMAFAMIHYIRRSRVSLSEALARQQESHRRELELISRQQRETYEAQNARLLAEVRSLSQQLASEQSERIRRESSREMQGVVEPLKQHLEIFGKLVRESRDSETAARSSLKGQIEQLMALNRSIGDEARELTKALKGDSKVQGDWGEAQLTTLLEQGGLQPDIHFSTQQTRDVSGRTIRNEEGNLRRPDVVIMLPDNRRLVVDSKVSLSAFAEYTAATDPEEQKRLAKKHLESVRKHVKELSDKNYPALIQGACDQSLMFMPVEGAFLLALRLDAGLLRYAAALHVAIVTPTHLFSVVQLAAQLWRQDAQDRNTQRIAEVGGRLYDKLALFLTNFDKVGETLDRARATWSDARAQLASGRGNALRTASQLRDLGAKVTKILPDTEPDETDASAPSGL